VRSRSASQTTRKMEHTDDLGTIAGTISLHIFAGSFSYRVLEHVKINRNEPVYEINEAIVLFIITTVSNVSFSIK
jgi:hypothetical protein